MKLSLFFLSLILISKIISAAEGSSLTAGQDSRPPQSMIQNPIEFIDALTAQALYQSAGVADLVTDLGAYFESTVRRAKEIPKEVIDALDNQQINLRTADLAELGEEALHSLSAMQFSADNNKNKIYYNGEWPIQATFTGAAAIAFAQSFKKTFEDPTSFVTGSIMNVLNDIRKLPTKIEIQRSSTEMMNKAYSSLEYYRDGLGYNFFPPFTTEEGRQVHKPKDIEFGLIFEGILAIPADSDTTSTVLLAKKKVDGKDALPEEINQFSKYLDINRTPHNYNALSGFINTGAFLTWFMEEEKFFTLANQLASLEKGPRMPWGKNDVDCVVNSNVLRFLSQSNAQNVPGYKQACQLVRNAINESKYDTCSPYYPNSFYLHYAATNALNDGAQCLRPTTEALIQHILKRQLADGSFQNTADGDIDKVQTTLFALTSLVNLYKDKASIPSSIRRSLQNGLKFLLRNARLSNHGMYWIGGIFFSGPPPIRHESLWRSDAFATTLGAKVFLESSLILSRP